MEQFDPFQDRVGRVFLKLCEEVNSPRSLACALLYKYGEHVQLCSLSIEPTSYLNAWQFRLDYCVTKYLSKYKGLSTGIDTKAVALQKFNDSEAACRNTNTRIREARLRGFSPRVASIIFGAQRKIASLLSFPGPGCFTDWTLADLFDASRWGPGVTFSLKGRDATLDAKIGENPISVTWGALPYLKAVIEADPHWGSALLHCDIGGPFTLLRDAFSVVEGCRVTTVDKDAKTDRTIAIEPTGNVFLQLGIGRFLRRKLRRVGIDLDDQTINQNLAKVGSVSDELATIDLSSASDSISRELVYELFPVDWAMLLDSIRSPKAQMDDGTWIKLEKFSSMGNGFTFELETLIFWSLSQATLEYLGLQGTVAVYGDDIILPSAAYTTLRDVFDAVGFSVNSEKTYACGYFRESCGKHYWDGVEVTPIYQKEECTTLDSIYRGANRLLRFAFLLGGGVGWCSILRDPVRTMIEKVKIKHYIPWMFSPETEESSVESAGLFSPLHVVLRYCDTLHPGLIGCKVLSFRSRRRASRNERALLAYWLRFVPESDFNGRVPVRRMGTYVERYRKIPLSITMDVAWL